MPSLNRTSVMTILPIVAAVFLMGASCYYQGKWSERWGEFPELEIFAEQLKEVPLDFGEWKGKDAEASDEKILKIAGAAGELVRTYTNPAGEQVRVSIICARLRDVFYHTPDRCYPAAGFEMQGEPVREVFDINGTEAQFFTTSFFKSEPTGSHAERGYWSWSADGTWLAPSNEKLTFAGKRALYKLYVFGNVPTSKERTDHDYCGDFIRAFVPVLQTALRPAMDKAEMGRSGELEFVPQPKQAKPAEPTANAGDAKLEEKAKTPAAKSEEKAAPDAAPHT